MSTNHNQSNTHDRSTIEQRNLDAQGNVISEDQEEARHPWEERLNGDELASMPYLEPGTQLNQERSYLNLNQLNGGPFTPSGARTVREGDRIVAQQDIDPTLWRKLLGER